MKHLLICVLAGMLIIAGVLFILGSESDRGSIPAIASNVLPAGSGEGETETVKVGLLFSQTETMEEIHFRRMLEEGQSELFSFHFCEAGTQASAQWQMFQKMLGEGYGIIFVKLVDSGEAQRYANVAVEQDIHLIFLGAEPDQEVLDAGEKLYFLGFSDANSLQEAARHIATLWRNNQQELDYFPDSVLAFSFLSSEGFEESGKSDQFASYLAVQGVEGTLAKDSVTSMFSFDIHKEIDRIWVADTELLICTSSSDARKSLNYLNDPTEFSFNRIQMVVLTADEAAQTMVENGEILLAIGTDGQDLGQAALRMIETLIGGEPLTTDAVGVNSGSGNRFYVANRVVRSPLLDQRAPVETDDDDSSTGDDGSVDPRENE